MKGWLIKDEEYRLLMRLFQYCVKNDDHIRFKVWQDEFHPKMLSKPEVFQKKAEHIHQIQSAKN